MLSNSLLVSSLLGIGLSDEECGAIDHPAIDTDGQLLIWVFLFREARVCCLPTCQKSETSSESTQSCSVTLRVFMESFTCGNTLPSKGALLTTVRETASERIVYTVIIYTVYYTVYFCYNRDRWPGPGSDFWRSRHRGAQCDEFTHWTQVWPKLKFGSYYLLNKRAFEEFNSLNF